MLGLITKPIEIGLSLAGGAIGLVRSRLGGDDSAGVQDVGERVTPPTPEATTARPTSRETATEERPSPEPSHDSDWDEDAPVQPGGSAADDLILLDRVKTEIFRPGDAEKGNVNVNVENGVVFLRGRLDDPAQSEYFEVAAAAIDGVVRVENLIATTA
jgi:hypothetical protein